VEFQGASAFVIQQTRTPQERFKRNARLAWVASLFVVATILAVNLDSTWLTSKLNISLESLNLSIQSHKTVKTHPFTEKMKSILLNHGSDECNEACMYIKYRMKRAWEVGTILFDACTSMGLEGCGNQMTSPSLCECEKKAANTMCAELEYAWIELCPKANSEYLQSSVCSGEMMTDSKTMCKNLETLPGVLVNYWPMGIEGLSKIDDKYVKTAEQEFEGSSQEQSPLSTTSSPSNAPSSSQAPPPEEGGDDGGVASGMDASDR
jgi:hypothetical protein